jgi:hypothetical protein
MKIIRNIAAGLLFFTLMPLQAFAQTSDAHADHVERAHRVKVVKHRVHKIRHGARKAYHKVVSTALSPVDRAAARHRADERSESH